ncbi:TetR/AcrR family transcriptional regulator [Actinoallomurus rhizosphaericola]|uniref:TetR/AcrR family transcriptional regulator n=1 Tax=Actinoallomurus rhizosphaericola TaxID=2952536 RepID=UPI002091841B|nr:TetR/AcrR family transcriptional regulator [Actinoallomurus rhizosphaericola]MCO5994403.1 TetR family transcriptional regulator [Actinoallomurus rhizosphaericola]
MRDANQPMSRAERRRRTEGRILAAARARFAEVGYDRTTIRAVAAAAEVDPALVMQYFGDKKELFRRAVEVPPDDELPGDPAGLIDLLLSIVGVKLGELPQTSLPLLRSTFTHPEATERMRAAMTRQVEQASAAIPGEEAELRAALILAILFGVSTGRNLIELGPLRDATPEQITRLLRPCFEALTGQVSPGQAPPET